MNALPLVKQMNIKTADTCTFDDLLKPTKPAARQSVKPLLDLYPVLPTDAFPLDFADAIDFIEVGDKVRVLPHFGRRPFEGYVEVSDAVNQRALVRHWRGNYRMEVGVDELELLVKAGALTATEATISA